MEIQIILALAALGCCTGFLAGLLGIGGGMVLTPFLTLLLGYAGIPIEHIVHVAIATSMGTILFTSLSSVRAHAKRGAVLWNVVFSMAPGILVGAVVGAQVSGALPTFWVALIFAVFVYTSAAKMFLNAKPTPSRHLPGPAGMFGAGTAIGVISALVGAGGGFISVPFMTWCNVKMHNAVGTSAAFGFPIAFAGTIGYIISGWHLTGLPGWPYTIGYIHLPALVCDAETSIFFAPFGAKVAHSIDTKPLKRIFASVLFLLATYMLYKAISAF